MSVRLPAAEGAVVLQALRAATGDLEHAHPATADPDGAPAVTPPDVQDADPGAAALADALVQVAGTFLAGKITAAGNPDLYQVIVHVGPEALTSSDASTAEPANVPAGTRPGAQPGTGSIDGPRRPPGHRPGPGRCHIEDGPAISPAAAQRIACQATVSWMLHDHAGNLLDAGRRHRTPPPKSGPPYSPIL